MNKILEKIKKDNLNEETICIFLERFTNFIYDKLKNLDKYVSSSHEIELTQHIKQNIQNLTHFYYNSIDKDLWNWIKNNTIEYSQYDFEYDTQNISNYLHFLNVFLSIFKEITNNFVISVRDVYHDISVECKLYEYLLKNANFTFEFNNFKNALKEYNLCFNEEEFIVENIIQHEILEKLKFDKLSNQVYRINSSIDLDSKIESISQLAKYMWSILNDKEKKISGIFNNEWLNTLKGQCNGYFRHSISDTNDEKKKKFTKEWLSFSSEKKDKIIEKTLSVYLGILSILDENELDKLKNSWQ